MKISLVNLLNEGRKSISVLKPLAHSISQAFTQPNLWPDVDKVASIIIDLIEGEDVEDTLSQDLYAIIDLEEEIPSNEFERLKSLTDDKNMISFLNALQTGSFQITCDVDILDLYTANAVHSITKLANRYSRITVPRQGILKIVKDHGLLRNEEVEYNTSQEFINDIVTTSTFQSFIIHELYHSFQLYNTWYMSQVVSPHYKKMGVRDIVKSVESNPSLTSDIKEGMKYLLQDEEVWARIQQVFYENYLDLFESMDPEEVLTAGMNYFKKQAVRFVHKVLQKNIFALYDYQLPSHTERYLTVIYFQLLSHQFDQLKKQYPDLAKKALLKLRPNLP